MARSYLGQGHFDKALELVKKSIAVFHSDKTRQHHDSNYIDDPELGSSFVVQGDILFNLNNLKESIASYREAQRIYYYLYRAKHSGVEHLSYLYTQGAKSACKLKDLYHYKCFGRPQIKEFGMANPKTISMLEYCKEYNLDLWGEGD